MGEGGAFQRVETEGEETQDIRSPEYFEGEEALQEWWNDATAPDVMPDNWLRKVVRVLVKLWIVWFVISMIGIVAMFLVSLRALW